MTIVEYSANHTSEESHMSIRTFAPALLIILGTCAPTAFSFAQEPRPHGGRAKVLVLGTIHHNHGRDSNYTFYDVIHILSTFRPDIIGVEIRPQDFRRLPYLEEMMIATIWGSKRHKPVYPIDWWTDSRVRSVRDSLSTLPEYIAKEQRLDSLVNASQLLTDFDKKYGSFRDQLQNGYLFWNGDEYNDYYAEHYRLSMQIYGDSPFNLFYKTRNDSMMALILEALQHNPGGKMIVLTGAEHKHYFDRALRQRDDVEVVQLSDILPLAPEAIDPEISAFFDERDDLPYYLPDYPLDMNAYYYTKLIPLVHGPDMDFNPDIIPEHNIDLAERFLQNWKQLRNDWMNSDSVMYEAGWLSFLRGRYEEAVRLFTPIAERVNSGAVTNQFFMANVHRNLGWCHDCMGNRTEALTYYLRAEEMIEQTYFKSVSSLILKDYKDQPFSRGKK